jgi:hypothetical protein
VALAVTVLGFTPIEGVAEEGESKLKFSGDLRGRWEGFWFSKDETGSEKEGRRRIRYRLRLDAKAAVNPHAALELRIGTGAIDNRSGNQTLGSPVDFGPSLIGLRRAFLILTPYENGGLGNRDGHWAFQFGRVPVPFVWKSNGKDIMLWDNDINPAGVSTNFDVTVGGSASIYANLGGFVIDENKSDKDPYLVGGQLGVKGGFSEKTKAGIRGSFYYFDNLDEDFIERGATGVNGVTSGGGNIPDGLTGDITGGDLQVAATQAFLKFLGNEAWPLVAFGGYSTNFSAAPSDTFNIGKENIAYNVGVEGGSKKKSVQLGIAYYHIEANAFPSMYIDSDLLDGHTNRRGVLVYFGRQVMRKVDFKVQLFRSDAIATDIGFEESVEASERSRIQVDLVYKF